MAALNAALERWQRRKLARLHSVADVRRAAKRALPPMVFDYVDGGAEDEDTVRGNVDAFADWWLRPRILEDVSVRDRQVELLGAGRRSPIVCGPAGLAGLVWPGGEAVAAAAAGAFGVPFVLSTASSASIEETRAATDGALWLQLYLWRDRDVTGELVDRAADAKYEAICLTVDVPLSGQRERDLRNGMTIPPRIGVRNSLGVVSRPAWMWRVGRNPVTFGNVKDRDDTDGTSNSVMSLGAFVNRQLNPSANWADLRWLRDRWPGKLLVKGVLDPGDAARLVDEGVDAVVVSNHGGRQLDGAVPALTALPAVVDAIGDRAEVLLDGGVRRGTDIAKAIALGASACFVARPYLFGLATAGAPGVTRVLELLDDELDRALALLGVARVAELRGAHPRVLQRA